MSGMWPSFSKSADAINSLLGLETMRDMIVEVRKSYETAVDIFTPLFEIDSPEKLQADFANRYAEFNDKYLKEKSFVTTSSHIVADKILGRVCKYVQWTARLRPARTDHAATTKSEGASAEDSGSCNFHRNRLPGTTIEIIKRGVLLCQCTSCLKVFFLC